MSDDKLCPMRKDFEEGPYLRKAYCLKENCAWWIEAILWGPNDEVPPEKWDRIRTPGRCAILGIGKYDK